jgi:hypothetical protein
LENTADYQLRRITSFFSYSGRNAGQTVMIGQIK